MANVHRLMLAAIVILSAVAATELTSSSTIGLDLKDLQNKNKNLKIPGMAKSLKEK